MNPPETIFLIFLLCILSATPMLISFLNNPPQISSGLSKVINLLSSNFDDTTKRNDYDDPFNFDDTTKRNDYDDPFEEWPILKYFEEGDFITNRPQALNGDDASPSELEFRTSWVEMIFLGFIDDKTVAVYDPSHEELENNNIEFEENPHNVYEKPISSVVEPYFNPMAEVRKRQLDGAKTLCKLENSDYNERKKIKHREKLLLESEDAKPCETIEKVINKLPDHSHKQLIE